MPKTCTVGDVIKQAREQLELPDGAIRYVPDLSFPVLAGFLLRAACSGVGPQDLEADEPQQPFSVYTESSVAH